MAYLLIKGSKHGQRVLLKSGKNSLGRHEKCDVVIDDSFLKAPVRKTDSVSRRHAVITGIDAKFYIEDGDGGGKPSRNGTFVNEQAVPFPSRVQLKNKDIIRLCDVLLLFFEDDRDLVSVEVSLSNATSVLGMRSQSADKLNTLLDISNSLSNTFEIDAILHRILDGLFQLFAKAERCFLITREIGTTPLNVMVKTRLDGDDVNAHFSPTIVRRCLENLEAILGNDLSVQFPESDSVHDLNARSIMCVPLWSQNRQAVGAIQMDSQDHEPRFDEQDLKLLLGVASQASIALSNARQHRDMLVHRERERDLEIAQQVQLALLPQRVPDLAGYHCFAYYESAQQIGGDYYDFIPLPGERLAVLIGDVVGKGVPAALLMAKFSVEARVCLENEPDIAVAVRRLNTIMAKSTLPDRFVTLVAMILDLAAHTIRVVNAGHPTPLLFRRATGQIEEVAPVAVSGLPISILEDYGYTSSELQLQPGDEVVLFSDGVTEAMDVQENQFGFDGIRTVLKDGTRAELQTGQHIIQAVKRHSQGLRQSDDITLVTLTRRVNPRPSS